VFDDPADVESLIALQLHRLPRTPSDRVGRKLAKDLERLIMRCLAKSPGDRPESALQLCEDLFECLDAKLWTMREAEAWWAEPGLSMRRRSADGSRLFGTSRDDTSRIPEWQWKTQRVRG